MEANELRALCGAWPGTTEDIKWGNDLVFSVVGKMFCVLDATPSTEGGSGRLSFKVGQERFLEFTDRPGIIPAPYMARAHWISLTRPDALSAAERDALIRGSYDLVVARLPKKTRLALGLA